MTSNNMHLSLRSESKITHIKLTIINNFMETQFFLVKFIVIIELVATSLNKTN